MQFIWFAGFVDFIVLSFFALAARLIPLGISLLFLPERRRLGVLVSVAGFVLAAAAVLIPLIRTRIIGSANCIGLLSGG